MDINVHCPPDSCEIVREHAATWRNLGFWSHTIGIFERCVDVTPEAVADIMSTTVYPDTIEEIRCETDGVKMVLHEDTNDQISLETAFRGTLINTISHMLHTFNDEHAAFNLPVAESERIEKLANTAGMNIAVGMWAQGEDVKSMKKGEIVKIIVSQGVIIGVRGVYYDIYGRAISTYKNKK